jgi:hypothetical protein
LLKNKNADELVLSGVHMCNAKVVHSCNNSVYISINTDMKLGIYFIFPNLLLKSISRNFESIGVSYSLSILLVQ